MIDVETDKSRALLKIRFAGRVTTDETRAQLGETGTQLEPLEPGFRILADLSRLESMDPKCADDIGKVMELCDAKGVSKIVRIIPDPKKDIGLSILSLFHYRRRIPTVTCRSLEEAMDALVT